MARTAVTPMEFARAMVLAYRQAGRDPANALRQARITPSQLRHPDARMTAAQMEALSAAAMHELDDEALGWFSRRLPWGSHGMLVRASLTAPTLGLALARWCRHHALLVDDVRLVFERDAALARVAIEERRPLGAFREICLVTLLRQVHGVSCWWIDARIPLAEVAFPFDAPPHADAFDAMFPGPVRFGARRAALAFDASYLDEPMRRDDAALQRMLQRGLAVTVLPYRRERLLAQRVRTLLRTRVGSLRDATAVAAALHVSPRTLHRQLHDEGCSLQMLKDEARRALAVDLLQRTQRPVKQVAQAAGFRSAKSFARAFRQWTGQSPVELRAAGSGQP
jgi:AraC-like DNA-binding protein